MYSSFKLFLILVFSSTILYGELIQTYFRDGKLKAQTNYIDGTHTKIKMGIKDGIEKVYYEEGALAYFVNYISDKRDGKLTWYDKKGNLLAEVFYKKGLLDGLEKSYFTNGIVKHIAFYVNDMKEGAQYEYFDNAQLALVVNYRHNKKEGLQHEYTYSGKLFSEVNYINNYKEGNQKWFNKEGNITKIVMYKMDRPINIMKKLQKKETTTPLINNIDFSPQKPD